jgi:ElaB/YqjD/DUF883 family membrane-anchored ribosome-binding protein
MRTKRIDPDNIDLDYLKQEFNRFRADLNGVKEKLGVGASEALDQMSAYLNGGALSSRMATLESDLEALTEKLKGGGKNAVNKLESQVTQRPITSVAIAFGLGVLASQLVRRS